MSHQAPFTLYIKVVPQRGKRFEYIRSLQKSANRLYANLVENASLNLARPGGGQAGTTANYMNSDYTPGLAVKPQFGETPAQICITGFYLATGSPSQSFAEKQVISAGAYKTGPTDSVYNSNPTSTIYAEVLALKTIIDAALVTEGLDSEWMARTFRIDYKNVVFGDRGLHFPV